MLAPGAVLRLHDLVFDVEPAGVEPWLEAWLAGAVHDPARAWTGAVLTDDVRLEHGSYRWLFEPLLEHTGFGILDHSSRRGAYGACTRRR